MFTGGPSLEELAVLLGVICWLVCAWLVDDFGAELALMRCSLYSFDPCVSNGLFLLPDVSLLVSSLGVLKTNSFFVNRADGSRKSSMQGSCTVPSGVPWKFRPALNTFLLPI